MAVGRGSSRALRPWVSRTRVTDGWMNGHLIWAQNPKTITRSLHLAGLCCNKVNIGALRTTREKVMTCGYKRETMWVELTVKAHFKRILSYCASVETWLCDKITATIAKVKALSSLCAPHLLLMAPFHTQVLWCIHTASLTEGGIYLLVSGSVKQHW